MLHGPSNTSRKILPHVEEHMKIKKKNTSCIFQLLYLDRKGVCVLVGKGVFGSRYSRMDQLNFVVDNF